MGFWQKIILLILALFILGFAFSFFLHVRLTDVLFMEGLFIFVLGAYFAAGMGNPKTVDIRTTTADAGIYREYLEDQRPKQLSEGVVLMIIGAVLMVLAVVVGLSVASLSFLVSFCRKM